MYLSNEHIFTDHAVSQKSLPVPRQIDLTVKALSPTYFKCGVCGKLADSTTRFKRTFDWVDACIDCVEKIAIGKKQVAAYLANKEATR